LNRAFLNSRRKWFVSRALFLTYSVLNDLKTLVVGGEGISSPGERMQVYAPLSHIEPDSGILAWKGFPPFKSYFIHISFLKQVFCPLSSYLLIIGGMDGSSKF